MARNACTNLNDFKCLALNQLVDTALMLSSGLTNVMADYWYLFDTGAVNLGTVLTSEVNVPIEDAVRLGDLIISYSQDIRPGNSYTNFFSMRFTGESNHHMAHSYGGPRALGSYLGTEYQTLHPLSKES